VTGWSKSDYEKGLTKKMSIKIKKCPATDNKEELLVAIAMHISDVQKGCAVIANKIIEAGINHDNTKMTIADVDIFMEERESGNYNNWLKSHRNNNRHHFHQLDNCPDDYNLVDVIESIVDCVTAIKARKGQTVKMATDYISPELLAKAFKTTIEMLENEIIVEND